MPFFFARKLNKKEGKKGEQSDNNKFVWSNNVGSRSNGKGKGKGKKKYVRFDKVEVQEFYFSRDDAPNMYYSRPELQVFNQSRFDDASKLRHDKSKDRTAGSVCDDGDVRKSGTPEDLQDVLLMAYTDPDEYETTTIRGIEHFVYPELQKEMITRKKRVQKEVLGFEKGKKADPQGWRLANHSKSFSQWARDVAMDRGLKYSEQENGEGPNTDDDTKQCTEQTMDLSQTLSTVSLDGRGTAGTVARMRRASRTDIQFTMANSGRLDVLKSGDELDEE